MIRYNQLKESSLSRIWKHYTEHDSGTISACRGRKDCGEGKKYTKSENKERTICLKAYLLDSGYGITKVVGGYIEGYKSKNPMEVTEESFFVVDLKDKGKLKKDLMEIAEKYEQDSITFSKSEGEYSLISTNTCKNGYPGKGKIGVKEKTGEPVFGEAGEFFSKIRGRPFVFKKLMSEDIDTIRDFSIAEIRSIKHFAEKARKKVNSGCEI